MNTTQDNLNFFSIFKRNLIFKLKKKINIDKDTFPKNTSLEELFSFYKTDKAKLIKSTNESGHGYAEFYEKHFSNLRDEKIKILELGSYAGASAAAFTKYFKNAKIFCLDINLTKFIYESLKIHPFGLDISNKEMLNKFFNKINFFKEIKYFDIIIDDGSHILSDQLKGLDFFFKYVIKNGYYVIEDYRFSEYFDHLKDIEDSHISEIFKNIKKNNQINSKLLSTQTIQSLKKNTSNIFEYKGEKKISDILFIQKLN